MNEITVPRSAIRSVDISSAKDCQNYQAEDYPQGEQFYTDALSGLALGAVFAPQHGERK